MLLSGIGPADQLKSKNIPVVRDLPGVGANLVDHPNVSLYFKDKHDRSVKHVRPSTIGDIPGFLVSLFEYLFRKSGPMTGNVSSRSGKFMRMLNGRDVRLVRRLRSSALTILRYSWRASSRIKSRIVHQETTGRTSRSSSLQWDLRCVT